MCYSKVTTRSSTNVTAEAYHPQGICLWSKGGEWMRMRGSPTSSHLVMAWRRGQQVPWPRTWLSYPLSFPTPSLGKDLGPENGVPPLVPPCHSLPERWPDTKGLEGKLESESRTSAPQGIEQQSENIARNRTSYIHSNNKAPCMKLNET